MKSDGLLDTLTYTLFAEDQCPILFLQINLKQEKKEKGRLSRERRKNLQTHPQSSQLLVRSGEQPLEKEGRDEELERDLSETSHTH